MNHQSYRPDLLYSVLAAKSARLNYECLQEISNLEQTNIKQYKQYMKKEPVTRMCCDIKSLLCSQRIKHYVIDNPSIQQFIRNMLLDMDVSFERVVGQLASAMPLGFSCAEIIFAQKNKKAVVKSIDVLDQELISFKGKRGIISQIIYRDKKDIALPYWKTLHVTRGYTADNDDPFGVPEMLAAMPYIKAKISFYSNMMVASNKLTTGILVASIDNSKEVKLIDSEGKVRKLDKATAIMEQMKNIESMPIMVVGKDDSINSIPLNNGAQFWLPAIDKFDKDIKKAFCVADHIVDGLQNLPQTATAVNSMFSVTDSTIYAFIQSMERELINKMIKPIIIWNFGEQPNYGRFDIEPVNPEKDTVRFNNLLQAMGYGAVDVQDYEVKNLINKFLGLPLTNKEKELATLYHKAMMQQMEAELTQPQAPESPVPEQ